MPRRGLRRWTAGLGMLTLGWALTACGPDPSDQHTDSGASKQPDLGKPLYDQYCGFCHGYNGEGYLSDNANALANPNFLASASDEFIRDGIVYGRPGTPMPAWGVDYGGPLVDEHVEAIVDYIRSWQTTEGVDVSGEFTGSIATGRVLYSKRCAQCHGDEGQGVSAVSLNNPWFQQTASDGFVRHAIADGRPGTSMPAYATRLADPEIDSLVAYLRTWARAVTPQPLPSFKPDLTDNLINEGGPDANFIKLIDGRYIPAADVKAAMDQGESFVILDARPHSDYLAAHISGSIAVPFYTVPDVLALLPRDTWIVTYCGCPHAISGQAANTLLEAGFETVGILDEGFFVWQERSYPVSRGRDLYERRHSPEQITD